MRKDIMRYLYVAVLSILCGCSTIKYEYEWMKQRAEARKSDRYIPWQQMKTLVEEKCSEIKSIYQGHSRIVSLSFGDQKYIESVSDYLDEILDVTDGCLSKDAVIIME